LKVFVIAALLALLFLLLYSKLKPYLELLKKILNTARAFSAPPEGTKQSTINKTDGKLVKCVSCGTWVPAERAIGARTGGPVYCSTKCIENSSGKQTKMAG
jgi:hypothetical protein